MEGTCRHGWGQWDQLGEYDWHIYTIMCKTASRKPLYSTGAQFGALWQPRWVEWRYTQLIHSVVQQKLTQHCEAITLQLKKKWPLLFLWHHLLSSNWKKIWLSNIRWFKEYKQPRVLSKKLGKYAYMPPIYFHLVILNVHVSLSTHVCATLFDDSIIPISGGEVKIKYQQFKYYGKVQ